MYQIFVYGDIVDPSTGRVNREACIHHSRAESRSLSGAIEEGEQQSYGLAELYDHVAFSIWNDSTQTIAYQGHPHRLIHELHP